VAERERQVTVAPSLHAIDSHCVVPSVGAADLRDPPILLAMLICEVEGVYLLKSSGCMGRNIAALIRPGKRSARPPQPRRP